ncbi:unnamed protein product, partial [marine sediment metagenome]
ERKYNVEIKIVGIIVNAFEKRKTVPKRVVDTLQKKYGDRLTIFNQKIRYLVHYEKSISLKREPVFISFPYAEASYDIIRLFSQVEKSVDGLG